MKNLYIKYVSIILSLLFIIAPTFSFAETPFKLDYSGLVKCDGVVTKDSAGNPVEKDRNNVCNFNALMSMVKSGINWLFFLTVSIATVALAYGGLLYISGSPKNISHAHDLFTSIAWGFIIMLIAWFAVITVVDWFITPDTKIIINTFVDVPTK